MRYFSSVMIAIITNLLFLPFWYFEDLVILPGIQLLVNTILLPVTLVALNVYWFVKRKIDYFPMLYLVVPLACLASGLSMYFIWGIVTGHFFSPDEETIIVVTVMLIISVGVSLILLSMAHAMFKISESHMILWRKVLAWVGVIISTGIVASIFGVIVYTVF